MYKKRLICLMLCVMTLASVCLQGCGTDVEPTATAADPATETGEVTETPPQESEVYLIREGVCDYSIVYEKDSEPAKRAANKLIQTFASKYKVTLTAKSSADVSYDPEAKEIYVGSTGFAESVDAAERLKTKQSYCIAYVGNKFVFVAGTAELLEEAMNEYLTRLLPDNASFNVSTGKPSVKVAEYFSEASSLHTSIRIGDVDLKNYTIVYEEESENLMKEYAERLRDAIVTAYGVPLSVVGDQSGVRSTHEILIGNTNREETAQFRESCEVGLLEYDIGAHGKKYVIVGGGYFSVKCAVQRFINAYLLTTSKEIRIPTDRVLTKDYFVGTVDHAKDSELRVMTWNILYEVYAENYYGDDAPTPPERIEIVQAVLEAYSPDVIGLQETYAWWQKTLAEHLDPETWGFYQSEYDRPVLLLYNKKRVTLEKGSSTLYTESYTGEMGRSCMLFGVFRLNSDAAKRFVFSTTHWMPANDPVADKQMQQLSEELTRLRGQYGDLPFFCTGDYNTRYNTERYRLFCEKAVLTDAFTAAKKNGKAANELSGLGNPGVFRKNDPYTNAVDHVFCSPAARVCRYETVIQYQIENVSDHAPRYADVAW